MTSSLRQTAYEQIREMLLSGILPPGTHLSARALGKHLGMSLIPVREAIGQLSHEGLVDHHPNRGAFVHWPTANELDELYEIREALECHAAISACGRIEAEAIATMRRCNATLREIAESLGEAGNGVDVAANRRWVLADAELHLALAGATGNRRMVELVGNLRIAAQVFGGGRGGHSDTDENRRRILREHDELIDAVECGDGERARRVLTTHIRTGLQEAKRLLAERLLGQQQQPDIDARLSGLLGRGR